MSPLLFTLYMAEIDERLRNRRTGEVRIGQTRLWNLAYVDDIVLLAKNREALIDITDTFRRFLKEKKLILYVDKTKIWCSIGKEESTRKNGSGIKER